MATPQARGATPPYCFLVMALAAAAGDICAAQLTAINEYSPPKGPIEVHVQLPMRADPSEAVIDLFVMDGDGSASVAATAGLIGWQADLAALFDLEEVMRDRPAVFVQLSYRGEPIGPALVLEPLRAAPRAVDALTNQVLTAFDRGDRAALDALIGLPEQIKSQLRRRIELLPPRADALSGWRITRDTWIVLETTAGVITLSLRPDIAPRTCRHVLGLVERGFYDGVGFHRVIAEDGLGRPYLVQTGDPSGTGIGGCGSTLPFEPSALKHDFGAVSMARLPDDPNSASSQFFICLGRDACADLDGSYTVFAEVVGGVRALRTIAASPLMPSNDGDPAATPHRPIEPIVITSARPIDAPPLEMRRPPVGPEDARPVER